MTKERALEILQERLDLAERNGTGVGDYYDVLRVAIESIKQTMWIPVTERLPKEDGNYLITARWECGEPSVYMDYFQFGCMWDDCHNERCEVTAWMPLPEPWEGEE